MSRGDLERLSKDESIELVLKLQRPATTPCSSSKPPSTDRKEKREQSRPGGAKPGHEGHKRLLSADPDAVVDHRPTGCPGCGARAVAERPAGADATAFGPRLHALVSYLKTFQAPSYERLEGAMKDLFGLTVSQGGPSDGLPAAATRHWRRCTAPGWWPATRPASASWGPTAIRVPSRLAGMASLTGFSAARRPWSTTSLRRVEPQ